MNKEKFDIIFSDVRFPEGNGISLLEWMNKKSIYTPFIIMTGYASVTEAVRAIKLGAKDYLAKPIFREQLLELSKEWLNTPVAIHKKKMALYQRTSPLALNTEKLAKLVALSDMNVLILGANGTGKESIAQLIHKESERWNKPFVAVNCGAIPKELASSYFFGHTKGAFTGALSDKKGYFELAAGGTLFLDELGTLPYDIQVLLLRVLQENVYTPVGDSQEHITDVRIISATNENLLKAIAEKRFREDLYHRLNEFEIRQPSLSECKEDIIPLSQFFINEYSQKLKKSIIGLTKDAEQLLLSYPWPGNIRELQHKIKRAVLLTESSLLSPNDFDLPSVYDTAMSSSLAFKIKYGTSNKQKNKEERERILQILSETKGNLTEAANLLGITRPTLNKRLEKYNLK